MSSGAIAGVGATGSSVIPNGFAALESEDFIKVLITELTNQDPLDPQDSGALLEQLSSLRNIESQLALKEQIENLVLQNQVATAGGLIGKLVVGLNRSNDLVEGLVTSIRIEDGNTLLELDTGQVLEIERLTQISEPAVG